MAETTAAYSSFSLSSFCAAAAEITAAVAAVAVATVNQSPSIHRKRWMFFYFSAKFLRFSSLSREIFSDFSAKRSNFSGMIFFKTEYLDSVIKMSL